MERDDSEDGDAGLERGDESGRPGRWWERSVGPFLGSLAINFGACFAMCFVPWGDVRPSAEPIVVVAVSPLAPTPPPKEPEPDVLPNPREIEDDRQVVEPVARRDPDVSDHVETDDDQPFQDARGDEQCVAQVDFLCPRSQIDLMGVGGPPSGRYGHRLGGNVNLIRGAGGSKKTQDAVRRALDWLARHQSPEGLWDADGFDAQCGAGAGGRCGGHGGACYDVGVTGLALEAFLGRGHTHRTGGHQRTVDRAVEALRRAQTPADGCIGEKTGHFMYNHALATYALAEAWLMEEDDALRPTVQRAVDFLAAAQNPGLGWRYQDYNRTGATEQGGTTDTSVTAWVVMALASARKGGIEVPDACFAGANAWLDSVAEATDGYDVTYGYTGPGVRNCVRGEPYVTTAAGMIIRQFTGTGNQTAGIGTLTSHLPDWNRCNLYEWYYGALAISQVDAPQGASWRAYNAAMQEALLAHQRGRGDGCLAGSWDPVCQWGAEGGRVYATACGALCLEVYYRYLPQRARQ